MKINNINKRLIAALMTGTMSLSFAGCGEFRNRYSYSVDYGCYLNDSYSLDELKQSIYFMELKKENEWDLHLAYVQNLDYYGNYIYSYDTGRVDTVYNVYHDIFTNDVLYTENITNAELRNDNVFINKSIDIESFLIELNFIQGIYMSDDLKKILEYIKSDYTFNYSKEKVKQK